MKEIVSLFSLLFCVQFLQAQFNGEKPQKVYSIVQEQREITWYQLQFKLWKAEIDKNKTNAEAWYNYYSANRALQNLSRSNTEAYEAYRKKGTEIVDQAMEVIPNTFEANQLKWWHGENKEEFRKYLFEAYKFRPNDERVMIDLLTYYELIQDREKYTALAKQYFKTNGIAPGILNWARNLLSELDQNAIVFTVGDNDTYSIWVVQEALNFRKDVKVLNTSLILKDAYRDKIFETLGMDPFPKKIDETKTKEEYQALQEELYLHIFQQAKRPIYVAVTAFRSFQEAWANKLYLTGLAYKYSEIDFDNLPLIKRNYEKRYLKDHLTERFYFHQSKKIEDQFNSTYLPALLKLYKHYQESEEVIRQAQLKEYIIRVSEKSGQQSEIAALLGAVPTNMKDHFQFQLLDVKRMEKGLAKIKSGIYMGKTEVTNQDYAAFLGNLFRSRKMELLEVCRPDSTAWTKTYPSGFVKPMEDMYHNHPAYRSYPVVNVSYESVLKYCDWLTEQYNSQRKRKFNKVVFRLPTEEEWRFAAGSRDRNAETCFEGDKIKNEKGCWLANIKEKGNYVGDGGFFMVKVDSYSPNGYGLFNTMGNVSEMIDEKGKAKGGSWNSEFKDARFSKTQTYTEPSPTVGFRIVMEIISE